MQFMARAAPEIITYDEYACFELCDPRLTLAVAGAGPLDPYVTANQSCSGSSGSLVRANVQCPSWQYFTIGLGINGQCQGNAPDSDGYPVFVGVNGVCAGANRDCDYLDANGLCGAS